MWLFMALLTTLSWAFADLFYKKGAEPDDKTSHIKTVIMVGFVMGIHAVAYMLINKISFSPISLITYFPVSALYILSMTIGYVGLRYIELSISSPVQNSSGMVTAILIFIFFNHTLKILDITAVFVITAGIIALAIIEKHMSDKAAPLDNEESRKYRKSFVALIFPVLYCIIDGLGTFADAIYLDELAILSEDEALLAYEFTFLICAVLCLVFLKVKGVKFSFIREKNKGIAAVFETAGQFFYVFAMAKNAIIAAPLIASYSVFSVLLSRVFLKEKLTRWQYAAVVTVITGIALLAISEAVGE